ncbi:MAG: hypothetical protein IPO77_16075 [Acidobacteria bacterium]|nr:hypothetical protein [Acidobacteriota bacterium]
MAGREFIFGLSHRVSRSTVLVAMIAISLIFASVLTLNRALAERKAAADRTNTVNASTSHGSGPESGNASGMAIAGQVQASEGAESSLVVGEFEGSFDARTRRFNIQPAVRGSGAGAGLEVRSNPSGDIAQGGAFNFGAVNSSFVNTGDNPATVSGEIQLSNISGVTLYNTRLVFTGFKLCPATGACNGTNATTDAGNIPGPSGFAFFNDGLVAYGNKLSITRFYGDIAAGANTRAIWTFAVTSSPPRFFFTYKVLADVGVAAESVVPAAIQVNANAGNSIVINGRGFTGTPTVELLPAAGSAIPLTGVSATSTQVTATVPANTAAGLYSVRVTNPGGTAGGTNSSTLVRKLNVTTPPDGAHTISGAISALSDSGPYLVNGNATISTALAIIPGTVLYVSSGSTITVAAGGNILANGGVPGVPGGAGVANPAQIVFTAQRSPNAALPTQGSWGGINATATSAGELLMRNVVVEFGGNTNNPQINITGSGRTLRFTDSTARNSGGAAISALGAGDSVVGFTRNQIDNNGQSSSDPAMALSANASLGLFELPGNDIATATSVGDPSYFYSSANDFNGNQSNIVQIGTDADAPSNDFTKSGVLVGQGITPIRIRGNCDNPAIIGVKAPAAPVDLTINPTARIQLAANMDFKVADYANELVGCLAANGYAGFYQGAQAATSNQFIEFDKIPGAGNFGAIFFSRNAATKCILNYVRVQNGGSNCSAGNGEVVVEGLNIKVTNSQVNNSSSGGLLDTLGAVVDTRGTTFSGNSLIIDTVAGGLLGDGNQGIKASLVTPVAAAADPLGRGVFVVDVSSGISIIRFLNTKRSTVTIGTIKIPAGALVNIAGGGLDLNDGIPGRSADAGIVTGIAVSTLGEILYFIDAGYPGIRAVNISTSVKSIGGQNINPGNVGTFATNGLGSSINALAVNPSNGDLLVADATSGINKVFKFSGNNNNPGATPTVVAGSGATSKVDDIFSAGPATGVALLQPRAIAFDGSNNLYVADTGHARIIRVDAGGNATLVGQYPPKSDASASPYTLNPFTTGLAVFNNKLYFANGNTQDIARFDTPAGNPVYGMVAGTVGIPCEYVPDGNVCGDGGPAAQAGLAMVGSTGSPPLAGITADSKGLFVLDQGSQQRGRIRYINLSNASTEVAGVTITANSIDTVAGSGKISPFDGGLATSASFNAALGVTLDTKGNMWICDTLSSRLRFINRGIADVTIFAGTQAEQTVSPGAVVWVNKEVGQGGLSDGDFVNFAGFDTPQGIFATAEGLYIADSRRGPSTQGSTGRRTGLIRFVNTSAQNVTFYSGAVQIVVEPGKIKTIAGGGNDASLTNVGNGAIPLQAKFLGPSDIAVAANGDIFIADPGQRLVRMVARATGVVSSLTLSNASPNEYTGLGFDSTGRLLVANPGNKIIHREKTPGSGSAANGFDTILSGTPLNRPRDVAEGKDGALYVTNAGDVNPLSAIDNRIVKITLSGNTGTGSVISGTTQPGYTGDGGPASAALLNLTPQPINVATVSTAVFVRTTVNIIVSPSGEIFFSDPVNNAIRRIR